MGGTDELGAATAAASVRTLPPPAIDPADVQALVPGLSVEDAERCASLATLVLEGALYPTPPPAPLPPPMYQATLSCAARLATSTPPAGGGPAVVSESIGAYTYPLAASPTADAALAFTETELELLEPWLPGGGGVYELDTSGASLAGWPADWWQRDLDRAPEPGDVAPVVIPAEYLTQAEGDARYARLGHAHAAVLSSPWAFATATSAADPGAGKLRYNAAAAATATELYVDTLDDDDVDVSAGLAAIAAGDVVHVQDRDDAALWDKFTITGPPVNEAGWFRFPVAPAGGAGPLPLSNNRPLFVAFGRPAAP